MQANDAERAYLDKLPLHVGAWPVSDCVIWHELHSVELGEEDAWRCPGGANGWVVSWEGGEGRGEATVTCGQRQDVGTPWAAVQSVHRSRPAGPRTSVMGGLIPLNCLIGIAHLFEM